MTEMRDARLKKALDSAPDGDARAADEVREAILNKARISAAAAAYKPARSRWWSFSRPWNSGLATVGLVAFVGVLIWNQGLLTQPQQPLSEAVPAPATQQANAPAVLADKKQSTESATEQRDRGFAMEKERAARAERKQEQSAQKSSARETTVEVSIAPPPPYMPVPEVVIAPAVRAPAPAAPAVVSSPAPAMMSPPPPPVMSMAPPPMPTVMARSSAIALPAWSTLRVMTPEGPVLLKRESLPPVTQALLQQHMNAGREPLGGASSTGNLLADQKADKPALLMQIELLEGGRNIGHLDIGQGELRRAIEQAVAAARKASEPTTP